MLHFDSLDIHFAPLCHIDKCSTRYTTQSLVYTCDRSIGSSQECWLGKFLILSEVKMRSMSFIYNEDPVTTGLLHFLDIETQPVISGVCQVYRLNIGIFLKDSYYLLWINWQKKLEFFVIIRLHVIDSCSCHLKPDMKGNVRVTLNQYLFPCQTIGYYLVA